MDALPFSKMGNADRGGHDLLWLVNRVVFHPRGFALAFHYEDDATEPSGWSLLGDGSEVWTFTEADDDASFANVESFLAGLRDKA